MKSNSFYFIYINLMNAITYTHTDSAGEQMCFRDWASSICRDSRNGTEGRAKVISDSIMRASFNLKRNGRNEVYSIW